MGWFKDLLRRPATIFWFDILVRVFLILLFLATEYLKPMAHIIQPEDMWRYRYPVMESQIPILYLFVYIIVATPVTMLLFGNHTPYRNISETWEFFKAFTVCIPLTGAITNFMKAVVGRPRPNFLMRCYGSEEYLKITDVSRGCIATGDLTGDLTKSFPSGHSSLAFSAFGILAFYIAGKMGSFNENGQNKSWRFIIPMFPIVFATYVALSRYSDYHHHCEDILVGSLLGIVMAYLSYRQFYPRLTHTHCHHPIVWLKLGVIDFESSNRRQTLHNRLSSNQRNREQKITINDSDELLHEDSEASINSMQRSATQDFTFTVKVRSNKNLAPYMQDDAEFTGPRISYVWDNDGSGAPFHSEERLPQAQEELLRILTSSRRNL